MLSFKSIIFLFVLLGPYSSPLYSQTKITLEKLKKMTFEELMNVEINVPGALTHLVSAETPASVTLITEENIKYSPARNIYDLIETYVPGAIWLNYEEGPQLGTRGLVSNNNTKYILQVNGQNLNNKGEFGAQSELEQWDISDILQIEIIRGSGSVTYGPGAIAGIIRITTHDAFSSQGLKIKVNYTGEYNSKGASISNGVIKDNYNLYAYASITETPGLKNSKHFLVTNQNESGYVGKDIKTDTEPLDYFADAKGDPQIKLYLDTEFYNNWRFLTRYTQQGSNWSGNETKTLYNGKFINQQMVRNKQWSAQLNFENKINDDMEFISTLSTTRSFAERVRDNLYDPDLDNVLNKRVSFGESEYFLSSVLNWNMSEKSELAIGAEYSYYRFGPGWGQDEDNYRLANNGTIVSGPSSNAISPGLKTSADRDGRQIYVGSGFGASVFSIFSEANVEFTDMFKMILSGRADKSYNTDILISPRAALITQLNSKHFFKVIGQRSVRMNTIPQLFSQDRYNEDDNTETIRGFELMYSFYPNENISINISGYRNRVDMVSWDGDLDRSTSLGRMKLYGFEADLNASSSFGNFGINFSRVKLINWELNPNHLRSGISYSDYNLPIGEGVQSGYGNDLTGIPNNTIKAFGTFSLNNKLRLHVNARSMWDFKGWKDGLTGLSIAMQGTSDEAATENSIAVVEKHNTYDFDFRSNVSLTYKINDNLDAQVFVINLLGSNDNKRYAYGDGNNKVSPAGVRFIEEPRVFGIKLFINR